MNKLILICPIVAAMSCAGARPGPLYTPRQLYQSPQLDGERIIVRGYITNGRCIYQTERRYLSFITQMRRNDETFDPADYDDDRITILGSSRLMEYAGQLSRSNREIHGRFVANYLQDRVFDPHACGRAAVIIDDDELDRLVGGGAGERRSASPGHSQRTADRSRPPNSSSNDEDRLLNNSTNPGHSPPPDNQAPQPQVQQLGLAVAAPPPR